MCIFPDIVLEDMRGSHVQHCQQISIGTLEIPYVPGTVAAIPINPMGCDGITWDVPQSSMPYASIPGVHPVAVYHGMHGMGDGTLWDIPSMSLTLVYEGSPKITWTVNGNVGQPS